MSYTGEGRALSENVGQLFSAAADAFRNQLTTLFKKQQQRTSGGKSLQVQVTIHDSSTRALNMESDESYELYISEADDTQVIYTDPMFNSTEVSHRIYHSSSFLDQTLALSHPIQLPLSIF
jgi:hypothetical protein